MVLKGRQVKILDLLLEGHSVRSSAGLVGVSERQVFRWMSQSEFRKILMERKARQVDHIGRRLLSMADQALDVLEDVMNRPDQAGQNVARMGAVAVLDQLLKWKEVVEIDERLTELERVVFGE